MTTRPDHAAHRLSPVSVTIAGVAAGAGIISGGVGYAHRSTEPAHHSAGTAAWWAHIALTAVTVAWIGAACRIRRRRGRAGVPLLLAPLGATASRRLDLTRRTAPGRTLAAAPLMALLVYNAWRAGEQLLGGLDPHFTANAWGGPTYVGAMYCHYLDVGLISAAAALLIDRILLGRPSPQNTSTTSTAVTGIVVLVALSAMLPTAVTGTPSPAERGSSPGAPLRRVVDALAHGRRGAQQLPPGFVAQLGYRPTRSSAPEAPWVNPRGGCSFPTGSTPYGFAAACEAHDLGYDVLRYAADTGHPLGADARSQLDDRFAVALDQRCDQLRRRAGCRAVASVYVAGVRFNTWRQGGAAPGPENVGQWLTHLGTAMLTTMTGI